MAQRLVLPLQRGRRTVSHAARRGVARLLPRRRTDRPLWIFGGSSGRQFCDNSRALFEHVLEHRPDVDAVWQIDADSPDVERLPPAARWVDRSSLEAARLTRAADVVVFSHGVQDVSGLFGNRRGVVVRLGHGLTAFGRARGATPVSLRRMVKRVSIAPVASEFERGHKRDWGFSEAQLPITGLARWDTLRHAVRSDGERTTVLFAPTWRRWLTPADFASSDYWHHVRSVLVDEQVRGQLDDAGLRLAVFAHPAVRSMLANHVDPASVELVRDGADLPQALARSALLLTDWSSIAFDALTIRVPTVFFQFDLERYVADRGTYVDLGGRLFGPSCRDIEGLRSLVERFVRDGRAFPDFEGDVASWAASVFAHEDEHNCARVVDAIAQARR